MIKISDLAQDTHGNVLAGVAVTVKIQGTETLATLYSDEALTPLDNPVITNAQGVFECYVQDGDYDLVPAKSGYTAYPRTDITVGGSVPTTASGIANIPAGNIVAVNVQLAIDELDTEKVGYAALAATSGAALAGIADVGNKFTGATVEAALQETRTAAELSATTGAGLVGATASGSLSVGTVATQLVELDTEKAALSDLASTAGGKGAELVGFLQAGAGAVARTMLDKARETISAEDFGGSWDGVGDDSAAIQAAADSLSVGGEVLLPETVAIASSITTTDKTVIFRGKGITGTVVTALAAMDDMFRFDTATVVGGSRQPAGGLIGMTLNGNSMAVNGLHPNSVNFGFFDQLYVLGCTGDQVLLDSSIGQPSAQHNYFGTIVTLSTGAANGVRVTGSEAESGLSNASLNYFGNIYTLQGGTTPSGDGFVFGFSDGNYIAHLRNFRVSGGTGYALKFLGSDVSTNYHARLNVIAHCQAGGAGIIAKSGTVKSSASNKILCYSLGNGSPRPTVETGATLAWQTNTSGNSGTFTPTLFGSSTAGSPGYSVQKGRWEKIGSRVFYDLQVTISSVGGIAGNVRIGGLPLTMANDTGTDVKAVGSVTRWKANLSSTNQTVGAHVSQGADYVELFQMGTGLSGDAAVVASNLASDSQFYVSGSFPAFEFSS